MRKGLKKLEGVRGSFTGKIEKFGIKENRWELLETVLLLDVKYSGRRVADHIWMTVGKNFASAQLVVGDTVSFDARVTEYEKGYKGSNYEKQLYKPIETDYRLSNPTKVKKISEDEYNN